MPPRRPGGRFFALPYREQLAILAGLLLIEDDDRGLPLQELMSRCFRRARDRGQLAALRQLAELALYRAGREV
jgi:hypothetical protein